jgi:protein-disulfide isomerase
MPTSDPNESKAQRRAAARARALALKKKQEAADRRARVITLSVLGVVVAVLVAVVVFILVREQRATTADTSQDVPLSQVTDVPSTARADGGIPISTDRSAGGEPTAGVPEVGIYFDYLCPFCGQFEQTNVDTLESLVKDGKANVVMYPVSILDRYSQGSQYSTRAASASAWVADKAPERFLDFHEALFAHEPEEQTPGHTNQELADIAVQAGVPQGVADGIASGEARRTFGQWVYSASREAGANNALANPQTGAFSTPSITVDGTLWAEDWRDPAALARAVAAATR